MDVEILSRIQFAFTIAFHYIYPPLSIGLGLVMVFMEAQYLRTGNVIYEKMTRFWLRIFALIFGIGVATGIVMEFEFGTNWAVYSRYVGDVFGSALAAEGIFAFALESGFLGILIFGWNRVGPRVHFFSTIMVTLGSMFSAIWIVVANSWQQTPTGYHIVGEGLKARAEITDFWAMVFNPSSVERISHVWLGSFLAGAFLVMSVSAWYLLKGKYIELSRSSFSIALGVGVVSALLQLVAGHRSADVVAHYQPAKLAAMEGHFDSMKPADLYLFGWVDKKESDNDRHRYTGRSLAFCAWLYGCADTRPEQLSGKGPAGRCELRVPDLPYNDSDRYVPYSIDAVFGLPVVARYVVRKTLAVVDLRVGRIPAADCQPGGLVYGRGWTATLGGL